MKKIIFLHGLFLLYSFMSVFSKLGGQAEPFSLPFFGWYGAVFLVLGLYAIGWQQVLKQMPLSRAYMSKAVVVMWGMLWGALLFQEAITPRKIIGACVVMAGVVLFSLADDAKTDHRKPAPAVRKERKGS